MKFLNAFAGQLVDVDVATDALDVDETFPITVPVPVEPGVRRSPSVTGVLVAKCDDPGGLAVEAVQVRSWSWANDVLTIDRITGLEAGTTYRLTLLCLSMES